MPRTRSRARTAAPPVPPPATDPTAVPLTPKRAETIARQYTRTQRAVSAGFATAVGRSAFGDLLIRVRFQDGVPQFVVCDLEVVEQRAVRIPINPDATDAGVPAVLPDPGPVAAAG